MAIGISSGYGYGSSALYGMGAGSTSVYGAGAGSVSDTEKDKQSVNGEDDNGSIKNPGESDEKKAGRKSSPAECETCKNRKYQDGSDEMVSFKTAQHVSPEAAGSAVRGHEQEHVSNAYAKAAQNNGKVISANVQIHTAICPECGRSYVSGGTTSTQIKYYNEENPYQQELKSQDAGKYRGMNLDLVG